MAATSATMRAPWAAKSCASALPKPSMLIRSAVLARALVPFDEGIRAVVVDGLEVLRLDHVSIDALVQVEHRGHVAHQVLDEFRMIVGALGHVLLVGALEQAVELARGLLLDDVDDLLDPHELVGAGGNGDVRALIVGATLGDALRAGAQARHRHQYLHGEALPTLADLAG